MYCRVACRLVFPHRHLLSRSTVFTDSPPFLVHGKAAAHTVDRCYFITSYKPGKAAAPLPDLGMQKAAGLRLSAFILLCLTASKGGWQSYPPDAAAMPAGRFQTPDSFPCVGSGHKRHPCASGWQQLLHRSSQNTCLPDTSSFRRAPAEGRLPRNKLSHPAIFRFRPLPAL